MQTKVQNYQQIDAHFRRAYPNLTDFERATLTIEFRRNEILEVGLGVDANGKYPSALVAIANVLGYKSQMRKSIADILSDIAKKP